MRSTLKALIDGEGLDRYAQGLVKPAFDPHLPMGELRAAHARMGSRQVMGKLLLLNA